LTYWIKVLGVRLMKIPQSFMTSPPASGYSVHGASRLAAVDSRRHTRLMWLLSVFSGLVALSVIWLLET